MPDPTDAASLIALGALASLLAGLCTGVGAVPVLLFGGISGRSQDGLLGFAAGVMLAASVFSLILPALDFAGGDTPAAALTVIAGLLLGGLLIWLIHHQVPHEHFVIGREGTETDRLRRIWLFVIAITIHNFPEGLAVGVGFAGGNVANGTTLAIGIGLQNVPEGLAVAVALLSERYSRGQAFLVALLTGLVEPVGGLFGVGLVALAESVLAWALAFAAGAMLFVISHEIIPETHRRGYQTLATFSLMIGFAAMMFLDVVFG